MQKGRLVDQRFKKKVYSPNTCDPSCFLFFLYKGTRKPKLTS